MAYQRLKSLRIWLSLLFGQASVSDAAYLVSNAEFSRAAQLLRTLADKGQAEASFELAALYKEGKGVSLNSSQSYRYLLRAADGGHVGAADALGALFLFGSSQQIAVPSPAAELALSVAPRDHALAALFGDLLPNRNYPLALRWNTVAAEAGIPTAQSRLGLHHALGLATEKNLGLAKDYFEAAAAKADELGLVAIGMLHMGGFGGAVDIAEAQRWLKLAVDKPQSLSNVLLAMTFLSDTDENWDVKQASELLRPAAENGNAAAMFYLGELYRRGKLEDSKNECQMWLRRAASKGHLKAMVALTRLLTTGENQSPIEAAALCRQAADLGEPEAMFLLSHLYLQGKGLNQNNGFALRWAIKSSEAGFHPATELVAWIETQPSGNTNAQITSVNA